MLLGVIGPDKDEEKKELAKFLGAWAAESIQIGPKKTPDESVKLFKLMVEGDVWIARTSGEKRSKIRLDPTKTPKELDLIDEVGGKERVIRCIYEFKGDTLRVCRPYMQIDAARPKKIEASGDFVGLTVWKREK